MKVLFMTFLFMSSAMASITQRDVVYGEDHRQDVFELKDGAFVEYARATAAKVPNILIHMLATEAVLRGASLQERGICAGEKFSHQPTTSICSGFLISEKHLVTAGHCVRNAADCKVNRWVFDYKVDSAEQTKVRVPKESVYHCKKILAQVFEEGQGKDYAVIELNRPVKDRRPLTFRRSGTVAPGTPLVSIGYPSGLPAKIAGGAQVRSVLKDYLTSNLDTFQGNSGSAVLNADTGEVEGILVRGETDYIDDPARGCKVVNVCQDDGCRGEDVQLITGIEVLKDL